MKYFTKSFLYYQQGHKSLTVCCFKLVPYIRTKMDSSEKKLVIEIFDFREVLRPFLEPGRSAPFPGVSRMIREVSHV